jgi:hypothetical protein
LQQPVAGGHHPHGAQGSGLKRIALTSLVRLRATPVFRGIARAIPSQVQRRVKDWLVA